MTAVVPRDSARREPQASGTTPTEIFAFGPDVAATVIGGVRDVSGFPGRGRRIAGAIGNAMHHGTANRVRDLLSSCDEPAPGLAGIG